MYLCFLIYIEGNPEVLQYRVYLGNFGALLRGNCQFVNTLLLIGAPKLSKANCSTSRCRLHTTLFSTTLNTDPMLKKKLGHSPSISHLNLLPS